MLKSAVGKVLFLGIFFTLFVGCGGDFKSAQNESDVNGGEFCKAQTKSQSLLSPFAASKMQIQSNLMSKGVSVASVSSFIAGKIDIVADIQCLKNQKENQSLFNLHLDPENDLGIESQFTFSFDWPQGVSVQELSDAAENNNCIIGIANSGVIKKSQFQAAVSNDRNIDQQEQFAALDYWPLHQYLFTQGQIVESVRMAVVDTGVDHTHPDLSCNMWSQLGYDIVNNDTDPMDDDPNGHGTHVAGLIAACGDNGIGGAGIIPARVEIMGVKSLDAQGAGTIDQVANGIRYAVQNGADVINLSLEAPGNFPALRAAIQDAVISGVVVIGAAGNGNQEISAANPISPGVDSDISGMIAVGSIDAVNLSRSSFSNYSDRYVEISATGSYDSSILEGIYSTAIGGGYTRISGTSQAAPIVAGAAGLIIGFLKSRNITYTASDIENILLTRGTISNQNLNGLVARSAVVDFATLGENLERQYGGSSVRSACP